MPKLINLKGQKFGRLIVIKRVENNQHGKLQWLCECNCGQRKVIMGNNLKRSNTQSCGCLRTERRLKHGHTIGTTRSKTHQVWQHIKQRCLNMNNPDYYNYGARGIMVCNRWKNSFKNFLKDMSEKPINHQIDRIDNNGNYCKSNCRWVTSKINNRNRRNNHLITYDNKTRCLSAWAEEIGMNKTTLRDRIIAGWSIEKTLTTPIKDKGKNNE